MQNVLGIILGGGRGTRLYPLTQLRAKPAVPLAGRYRLIDIPVSNCINSGIKKIFVLTQFNSASLNRHIVRTYQFGSFSEGFVEILAAQQTPENANWYQGTADAVRQCLRRFTSIKSDEYLILSGDHLYRMDYAPFVEHHRRVKADVTLSVIPVEHERASEFGLVKIDSRGRVTEFSEKPKGESLNEMRVDTRILGLNSKDAARMPYIASMGIYVFQRDALIKLLNEERVQTDFGKEVIPTAISRLKVEAFLFDDYWEDIGTIDAFYRTNIDLVVFNKPKFSFFNPIAPVYTRPRFLPPSKIHDSIINESMICDGCIIEQAKIERSIVGIRSRLEKKTVIERTLLMGADFYQSPEEIESDRRAGRIPVGIGENSVICRAIIDKNARIGRGVRIINKEGVQEATHEKEGYWIRDGIVIVVKGAAIPDGATI